MLLRLKALSQMANVVNLQRKPRTALPCTFNKHLSLSLAIEILTHFGECLGLFVFDRCDF
jgi:hypothetical protein